MIDPVLDREGQLGIAAIDRAGAGIDHVLDRAVPGQFEQVDVAGQVRADIGLRVLDRIAHPGLGAEMDDPVDLAPLQRALQRGHVGKVEVVESKAVAPGRDQRGDAILLEADLVIVVEAVHPDHHIAARQQALGEGKANEAGGAGNQYAHGNSVYSRPVYPRALISWLTHRW